QPEHFHPAWHAWWRATAESHAVVTVGVERRVSHACPPLSHAVVNVRRSPFTIHYVYLKVTMYRIVVSYTDAMLKLWNETIEKHRREVRDANMETTSSLVAKRVL